MSIKTISTRMDLPETQLSFDTLKNRFTVLNKLQAQVNEACEHRTRDKVISFLVTAVLITLAVAALFAFLSNPITAGTLIAGFIVFQALSYGAAHLINKRLDRDTLIPKGPGAVLIFLAMGSPYLIFSLLTRKTILEERLAARTEEFRHLLNHHQEYGCILTDDQRKILTI